MGFLIERAHFEAALWGREGREGLPFVHCPRPANLIIGHAFFPQTSVTPNSAFSILVEGCGLSTNDTITLTPAHTFSACRCPQLPSTNFLPGISAPRKFTEVASRGAHDSRASQSA